MAKFTPEQQDEIFQALAAELLRRITAGPCAECGRSAALPQELQAVRQFLADNDITASMNNAPLRSIADKLPFKDQDAVAGLRREA